MTTRKQLHVLGIDWQVDFCDPNGTLFVPGAEQDTVRMAQFIKRIGPRVDMFHFTMDSHQPVHIAHADMWVGQNGQHPDKFTTITVDDVKKGIWRAAKPALQSWYEAYVQALETNGRYALMIWPPHCLIGSPGHNIMPAIWAELTAWSIAKLQQVNYVTKGSNPNTEHYSAMKADVQIPSDPSTKLNTRFLDILSTADELIITGQASSHCVANTVRDVVANFTPEQAKKFVIIKDLMSAVPIAKGLADKFFDDMRAIGVRLVDRAIDYI